MITMCVFKSLKTKINLNSPPLNRQIDSKAFLLDIVLIYLSERSDSLSWDSFLSGLCNTIILMF